MSSRKKRVFRYEPKRSMALARVDLDVLAEEPVYELSTASWAVSTEVVGHTNQALDHYAFSSQHDSCSAMENNVFPCLII
jgi:hypothetical protein